MEDEKFLKPCRVCGGETDVKNYYPSRVKKSDWLCPKCCQGENKQYKLKHRAQECFSLDSGGAVND